MRINLLSDKKPIYTINWFRVLILIMLCIFLTIFGIIYYILASSLSILMDEVNQLEKQFDVLMPRHKKYVALKRKVIKLQKLEKEYTVGKSLLVEIVKEQGYLVPESIKLEYLEVDNDHFILEGVATNNQDIIKLVANLKDSPHFYQVQLQQVSCQDKLKFNIAALVHGKDI